MTAPKAPPATLDLSARFPDPDAAYRVLADAHRGLSGEESAALNARLVLVLANQIGDMDVLEAAVALAAATADLKRPGDDHV